MRDDIDELKARIVSALDVTEFLDILGYDLVDIIDLFEDDIEENAHAFEKAVR